MKKQFIWIIFALAVVAILLLVILLPSNGPETIKIGIASPLTGGVAYQGERFVNGATLAAEEYNNNHDKKIQLFIEDDKCSASDATPVANKLVNIDGIDKIAVYCGASSPPYITQLKDKKGIIFISSIRMEVSEGKDPYVINLLPPPMNEMEVLTKHIKDKGMNNVAILYQQDFFGETYKNKFVTQYEKLGGNISLIEGYDKNNAADFKTSLTKIKDSDAEGIVNFIAHAGNYDIILRQAKELNIDLPFFSQWITENPTLINLAGDRAEGIVYTHPFKELNTPEFNEFKNKYKLKYNQEVNLDSVNGYNVVNLIAQLSENCDEDASCMVGKVNSGESYSGILGDIKFKDYSLDGNTYLKTISNGKFIAL